MNKIRILVTVTLFILSFQTICMAQTHRAENQLKVYVNETVQKVKTAEMAEEKRAILNNSLDKLIDVVERVEDMNRFSEEDAAILSGFKNSIMEKQDELNGQNGFEMVQDEDLDNFSNYVQQDLEQADRTITIGLSTALLVVLILLLL